tara:strand:- start:16426 stop:16638 length:213 start_codon:yes stop_codon:yes gene_type:complete
MAKKENKVVEKSKAKPKVDPLAERIESLESSLKSALDDLEIAGKTVDEMQQSVEAITILLNTVAGRMGLK